MATVHKTARKYDWLILPVALVYRILTVFICQTYFVPDEYWQSLEVAHKYTFGYPYVVCLFIMCLRMFTSTVYLYLMYVADSNANESLAKVTYGHVTWEWDKAIRSSIHPFMFVGVYKMLSIINLDTSEMIVSGCIVLFHFVLDSYREAFMWRESKPNIQTLTQTWTHTIAHKYRLVC